MLEYLIVFTGLFLVSLILQCAGVSNTGLLIIIILCTLPSLYAFWNGAPYIPSDGSTVKRMVSIALLRKGETAIDLGCGDGRLVRAANRTGANATGYEISMYLYLIAWMRSRGEGTILYGDFWRADYSQADVLFCYQVPRFEKKFMQVIWPQLKPGCRVVVNTFPFQSLKPEQTDNHIYLYVKP